MRQSILRRGRFGRRRKNKRGGILAFTISLTTILISAIVHNLWLLLLVLGVLIISGGWFWQRRSQTAV